MSDEENHETEDQGAEVTDAVSASLDDFKVHISRVPTTFDEAIVRRILQDKIGAESVHEVVLIYPRDPAADDEGKKAGSSSADNSHADADPAQEDPAAAASPTHRGFGFVTFTSKEAQDKALELQTIRGGLKPNLSRKHTMHVRPYEEISKNDKESSVEANICYLWAQHRCPYGDDCKFNHTGPGGCKIIPPSGASSSKKKKGKCFAYKKGKCTKGDECPFSHDFEPGTSKDQDGSKDDKKEISKSEKDCINWKSKGWCKKGDKCPYRHDEAVREKALEKKNKKKQQTDSSQGRKEKQPLSVRVFGMAFDTTEEDIKDFFKECGTIMEVTFPRFEDSGRSKGYCGVLFQSPKAVTKAVEKDGQELFGRWLQIQAGKMYLKKWEAYETNARNSKRSNTGDERGVGALLASKRPRVSE